MTPKAELHVHLEGTVRPAVLLELADRNHVTLPATSVEEIDRLYDFDGFTQFVAVWIATTQVMRTHDDFKRVALDYAREAAAHGATYIEAIFSPAERVARGVQWDDIFGGYCDGAQQAQREVGVTMRLTPDVYRGLPPDKAAEAARQAVKYIDEGIVGFGIGGPEDAASLSDYKEAFDIARNGGLGLVPHAGETGGAQAVREAIETLQPERIRHGIGAIDDPALVGTLADRGIVLDVCPTSNLRLGVVRSYDEHPLPGLIAAGVRCTVSTDDPAMFRTNLSNEYAVAQRLGVRAEVLYENAIAGALCDPATKQRLRAA